MQHPPYLKKGDTIGITCPSGYVSEERVAGAIELFKEWGFGVVEGETIGTEHNYFSGTDEARLKDLQAMLNNPDINAILMGRGGYGLSRIIDEIDLAEFVKHPKWICGFSDITVLHSHILQQTGIATLHSPMSWSFKQETKGTAHIINFYEALTGKDLSYFAPESSYNREGKGEGILTGGNLAILAHLVGSVSDVDTDGKLLFIEDVGEHYYKIDRMMLTLKRAGKLRNLAGLIVGGFTENEDTERPFGQMAEEIVWDKVKDYDYPVCFNFPAGHIDENYSLRLGMQHTLKVDEKGATLVGKA